MKKLSVIILLTMASAIFLFSKCNTSSGKKDTTSMDSTSADATPAAAVDSYGGFSTPEEWGHHIVTVADCGNCHTPKKMTAMGPVEDEALAFSGHPAAMPYPNVARKEMEANHLFYSNDLTSWVGPWGVSFSANITSDSTTGIGNWSEEQFMTCLRKGKYMGLDKARNLLPPMPWQAFGKMTDSELKAVFAYLKSTKPIRNIVPQPVAPLLAQKR
jgi:mono/diheme cytochrome c family protein